MSKKRKRQARRAKRSSQRLSRPSLRKSLRTEFNPDYSHVINDLKRIGLLAGSFIFLLVALSFVLR
jgi:hypothetical protein